MSRISEYEEKQTLANIYRPIFPEGERETSTIRARVNHLANIEVWDAENRMIEFENRKDAKRFALWLLSVLED